MLFSSNLFVSAKESNGDIENVINRYKDNIDINYTIKSSKQLIGISQENTYSFYQLSPYGYAILIDNENVLMEACYEKDSIIPFDVSIDEKIYYGGPFVYCIKGENNFFNLFDGKNIENEEELIQLESKVSNTILERMISKNNSEIMATTVEKKYVESSYFSSLKQFGSNTQGTCVVIAEQILLGYYDEYYNDSIVATKYEDGKGTNEAFHTLLKSYVYGSKTPGATSISLSKGAINNYLKDQGLNLKLSCTAVLTETVANKIVTELKAGRPTIASIDKINGADMNHCFLVYGYQKNSGDNNLLTVFTANMGWKGSSFQGAAKINATWLSECGYISSTCSTHTLSNWMDYDSTYHAKK